MTSSVWFAIMAGKVVSWVSKTLGLGAGATWPGEIAIRLSPNILHTLAGQFSRGVVLIAGTNGKTTTAHMLAAIASHEGQIVVHNKSGANLLNGIVSACIEHMRIGVKCDWGIFEVDENSLHIVLRYVRPKVIVLLNLFRDQLDRYGEIDVIAEKWERAIAKLDKQTTLILNCDDPLIAHLGKRAGIHAWYFGLNDNTQKRVQAEHAMDSAFCMTCGSRLSYKTVYFSHIGDWFCAKCHTQRPKPHLDTFPSPLPGLYNRYNTLAAVLAAYAMGVGDKEVREALSLFTPAFGRQEECVVGNKKVKIFLSKNPAGFNASLRTVLEDNPKALLFVLNDRIPDGRDVSWIWDVDIEEIAESPLIIVSGDRVYDMALRIKYAKKPQLASSKFQTHSKVQAQNLMVYEDLKGAIHAGLDALANGETLNVLATYSAMLEVRKILKGRKIA